MPSLYAAVALKQMHLINRWTARPHIMSTSIQRFRACQQTLEILRNIVGLELGRLSTSTDVSRSLDVALNQHSADDAIKQRAQQSANLSSLKEFMASRLQASIFSSNSSALLMIRM